MPKTDSFFDISQLDATFHLKALKKSFLLKAPLGIPEWQHEQSKLIRTYLISKQQEESGQSDAGTLEAELCRVFGSGFCIATGSGREAVKLALLGMDCKPGERVVMPAFCCSSVLLPVLDLGLEPVLADVGSDLQIDPESVRRVMRPGDRVLIVPHLFGGLADMARLVEIARASNAAVLDDAAQAIGLRGNWGWAGCGGDAGIFSFGLFKPLNAMGGGAFVTDDERLYNRASAIMQGAPELKQSKTAVLKKYLKTVRRKETFRLFLYNRLRRQEGSVKGVPKVKEDIQLSRIGKLEARLAASQLAEIGGRREKAGRTAKLFRESLEQIPFIRVPGQDSLDGYPRFVVQAPVDEPRLLFPEIFEALLGRGIEVQPTYRPLSRILREMGYKPQGEFYRSENLAEQLLCLPIFPESNFSSVLNALFDIEDNMEQAKH